MKIRTTQPTKRKDGRFSAYCVTDRDSKRHYVYASTKAECRQKLYFLTEELLAKTPHSKTTVEELCNQFLEIHCPTLSPTTVDGYKTMFRRLIPGLGSLYVTELTQADCQKFITEYGASRSLKSQKSMKGLLHTVLEFGRMNGIITHNVCEHITMRKTAPYQYYIYSQEEMKVLLDKVKGNRIMEIPVTLAAYCGLRASEIFGLRWQDIDFDKHELKVTQVSVYANHKKMLKKVPKTATSSKPITIPTKVIEMLKSYQKDSNLVVCNDDGSNIVESYYHCRFTRFLKNNNLPITRFHDLRHFVATSLMDAGLSDKEIAEYMRHSDTNMTRHYQHIRQNTKSKASKFMDELL